MSEKGRRDAGLFLAFGSVQCRGVALARQLVDLLAQAQALAFIVAVQQGPLQVEALGLRAVQFVINGGAQQVVGAVGRGEAENALGIFQRSQVIAIGTMQMTEVA